MILRMNATHRAGERRGAILLIVLTLLALFAVVALSFALYAESEALAARIRREAMSVAPNPDPLPAANGFLQQMLFTPATDTGTDTLSALRGHEMARLIYGGLPAAQVPYNGIGTVYEDLSANPQAAVTGITDRRLVVNYSWDNATSRIYDPEHLGIRNAANAAIVNAYIGKNAPYTYPDRNNMSVAVQDPTTGRIVLSSYHRPTLFNTARTDPQSWLAPPASTGLPNPNLIAAGSDDWLTAAGRFKMLRPRPADHVFAGTQDFPYPPMNPDGKYTGDVQNIVGTDGVQRNDAVWLNANLPVINWRGRNIIPLVAATVLPLDGRVNLNVAGNVKGGTSHHGFGPYEINAGQFLPDAPAMNNTRLGATTPNPRYTTLSSAAFGTPQGYAKVNWDAAGGAAAMVLPSAYQSDPTFGASGYGDPGEATNHPSLFNPFSWDAGSAPGKLFPHTDLRRAATRYSGTQSDYAPTFFGFGTPAPNSLNGFGLQNPSNINRALVTTISNSIQRPGLMPNYLDYTVGALQLNAGVLSRGPATLPVPPIPTGTGTDFSSATQLSSNTARLGAVDLNRPLADYRAPILPATVPAGALSPTNLGNRIAAETDRQTLARDIFVRLIVATGAKAIINPVSGTMQLPQPTAAPGTYTLVAANDTTQIEYDALRYLAQLAANAVDYIDNDDINTSFVWNPVTATTIPIVGQDTSSLSPAQALLNFAATAINDRVVFGVEKPRVLLNEVYAEIANDPSDSGSNKANKDFKVRFWIELSNPGGTTSPVDPNQAFGDTSVDLRNAVASVYRIDVHDNGNALRTDLFNPAVAASNVAGTTTSIPKLSFDFTGATATDPTAINNPFEGYGSNAAPPPGYGFRLIGPQLMAPGSGTEFLPDATMPPYDRMIQIPAAGVPNALEYTVTKVKHADIAATVANLANHAVVLRRLANPYIAFNDTPTAINPIYNPYITVDVFHDVAARDGIRVGEKKGMRPAGEPTATNTRASLGRQTPYYGHRDTLIPANTFEALQAGQPAMPAGLNGPSNPLSSFFNHNSNFTVPAEWLTHMDRPLINQMELLHVPGVKPHELTYKFTTGNTGAPVYHQHVAQWTSATVPLYRALELLNVKTWMNGVANGGRTPGKINVNAIWDKRVLQSLLDPQGSNGFTSADIDTIWTNLFTTASSAATRTKNFPDVSKTFDEYDELAGDNRDQLDRPFKSLGVAAFVPGGLMPLDTANRSTGLGDTILRSGMPPGTPAIFGGVGTHPYQKAEMLRKMQNNITTTTDTYMVVMTVGYFEVRNTGTISPTNPVVLGKEVFDEIPGDMRAKFFAVVDRSMLGTAANPIAGAPTQVSDLWMSETATGNPAVPPGSQAVQFRANGINGGKILISYEGRVGEVQIGTTLKVGTGANTQTVVVTRLGFDSDANGTVDPGEPQGFDQPSGIATITVTGLTAVVPAGTSISNGTLGNPGAQPNFDVGDPRYSGVVPYFGRIYPR